MDLEDIMQSAMSRSKKEEYHVVSLVCGTWEKKERHRDRLMNREWTAGYTGARTEVREIRTYRLQVRTLFSYRGESAASGNSS